MGFRFATCHPERPAHAKGLCSFCYMKQYDKARSERRKEERRKDPSEYSPNYRKLPSRPASVPTCGHPDRRVASRGLCHPCYQRARREGQIVVGMAQCHPDRPALAKGKCHKCYEKERYWNNPERMQEVARESGKRTRDRLREQLLAAYGGKCACPRCPETNQAFLTLEHVGGGGRAHRKAVGSHSYADLRRRGYPQEGFTLLCWNCNAGSRFTGTCPHMEG